MSSTTTKFGNCNSGFSYVLQTCVEESQSLLFSAVAISDGQFANCMVDGSRGDILCLLLEY